MTTVPSRGSPAESFEIPFLVTPRRNADRGAWRYLWLRQVYCYLSQVVCH